MLDALENRPRSAFVAWHRLFNLYYLVKRAGGRASTKQFVLDLIEFIDVAPTTIESLRYAVTLEMNDCEVAMQVSAAIACGAVAIATGNFKDYAKSPVNAATHGWTENIFHCSKYLELTRQLGNLCFWIHNRPKARRRDQQHEAEIPRTSTATSKFY